MPEAPRPFAETEIDLSRIDPLRLSHLWSVARPASGDASGVAPDWLPADLALVVREQLAAPLPPLARVGTPTARMTLGQLLDAPAPTADVLRQMKDWLKPMMATGGDLPREVAGVLYFAVIAASRLRNVGPISTLTPEQLSEGFTWAGERSWLPPQLTELFARAAVG